MLLGERSYESVINAALRGKVGAGLFLKPSA